MDYPLLFPKSSVQIAACNYDPTDLDDAYQWAGVFGISKLSNRDQAAAKKRAAELAEGLGFYAPQTEQDFEEALHFPFMQGKPDSPCLNPKCQSRQKGAVDADRTGACRARKGCSHVRRVRRRCSVDFPDVSQVLHYPGQ